MKTKQNNPEGLKLTGNIKKFYRNVTEKFSYQLA